MARRPKTSRSFADVTLGELRAVLASALPETLTLSQALDSMAVDAELQVEHDAANARQQHEIADWQAGCEAAGREAQLAAYAAARGDGEPRAAAAGCEAAVEAIKRFQRTHLLPEGLPEAVLIEDRGVIKRAAEKVREVVA